MLVWLGTPDEEELEDEPLDIVGSHPWATSMPALKLLKEISEAAVPLSHEKNHWVAQFVHDPELRLSPFAMYWKQLTDLCKVDYWNRLWIIQEIYLAV